MSNTGVEYILSVKDLFTPKIKQATTATEKLNGSVNKVSSSVKSASSSFASLGKAAVLFGVGYLVNEIVSATASLEGLKNQLNFASGSAIKGGEDFEWIRKKASDLGLDLRTSAESFAKFSGAARGTMLEGQGVKDIFEGVAMASTVMHMSADQANGTFIALQQMLSKGKVSAEELNGQLGERLPGALGIASRAMGVTTKDLLKMMQNGQLISEDFLPKFSAQLKKEFSGGLDAASHSMTANLNRLKTAFFELQTNIGESVIPRALEGILKAFNWITDKIKIWWGAIVQAISPLIEYVYELRDALFSVGDSFNWSAMLENALNAVYRIMQALKPIASFLLSVFKEVFKIVLSVVDGISTVINYLGDLFGMARIKSPVNSVATPKLATTEAANILGAGKPATGYGLGAGKGANAKGGTSTDAVEARGHQNFNISIDKLVEKLEFNTTNLKESGNRIKEEVTKALISAVNDFQLMATK